MPTMVSADGVSRHKCLIYAGHPAEQLPVIVPFLKEGLEENRRCLYFGNPEMVALVGDALRAGGIDVAGQTGRGALVLTAEREHLKDGAFNPAEMVAMLGRLVDEAVRDGYRGLSATGDMMWELGTEQNLDRLLEYEARLDRMFRNKPLHGICQYHRDSVPSRAVRDALITHRSTYLGEVLNRDNLFYIPPELLLENPGAAIRDKQGEWMWRQITRIMAVERERDHVRGELARLNRDLERRVREKTAELKFSNKELETFSFAASHDLQAPLRKIDAFIDHILRRGALSAEDREDFERIRSGARQMSERISALLNLSRIARHEMVRETVDLSRQAEEILRDLRNGEPERAVETVVEPGLTALGDPGLVADALENLLSNAWKFTARVPHARVEFGAVSRDGRRAFFVRDNGAGFDMSYRDKLFLAFSRLHSAVEFPGNGVGLATTQRIIRRHQGEIWAEAAPGRGATFYFTLPQELVGE